MIVNFLAVSARKTRLDAYDPFRCNPENDDDQLLCDMQCILEHHRFGYCAKYDEHRFICVCTK